MKIALTAAAALIAICIAVSVIMFIYGFRRRKPSSTVKPMKAVKTTMVKYSEYRDMVNKERDWFCANISCSVTITSHDGLKLCADVLEHENAKCTVIMMHGYRSSGMRDFALSVRFYHSLGCNIILPDQRACGKSEGKYITFGIKERFDCRDWVSKARELFGNKPIILAGISLGAATVMMTTGFELPENVKAVIADCGFTSPAEEITHVAKEFFHLPTFPVLYIVEVLTRAVAGFSMWEYSTKDALKTNRLPVLFIHGGDDNFVPTRMSLENFNVCTAEKEIFIAEKASHGISYLIQGDRYRELVSEFIKKHTGE